MTTIFKYVLEIKDRQLLKLRKGYDILSVMPQDGAICLWAMVDTEEPITEVEIEIFGTGNPVYVIATTKRDFLGTCIMPDGLVWHVFERVS